MAKNTPATVALAKAGVAFTLHEYDYDPNATRVGLQAAEALGVDPARLLNTVMARAGNATVCVLVQLVAEVTLKKLAAAAERKMPRCCCRQKPNASPATMSAASRHSARKARTGFRRTDRAAHRCRSQRRTARIADRAGTGRLVARAGGDTGRACCLMCCPENNPRSMRMAAITRHCLRGASIGCHADRREAPA